jgi:nickel transport protein
LTAIANTHAHNIKIFAARKGNGISGYVYSPGGIRIKNAVITVYKDGKAAGEVKTDSNGAFTYQNADAANYKFVYNRDGHMVEYAVGGSPVRKAAKVPTQTGADDERIFEIKEQLDRIENTLRFRDIIGAVGYIFGIAGLLILIKKKK